MKCVLPSVVLLLLSAVASTADEPFRAIVVPVGPE